MEQLGGLLIARHRDHGLSNEAALVKSRHHVAHLVRIIEVANERFNVSGNHDQRPDALVLLEPLVPSMPPCSQLVEVPLQGRVNDGNTASNNCCVTLPTPLIFRTCKSLMNARTDSFVGGK